jgi:hypothetical protein
MFQMGAGMIANAFLSVLGLHLMIGKNFLR